MPGSHSDSLSCAERDLAAMVTCSSSVFFAVVVGLLLSASLLALALARPRVSRRFVRTEYQS